MAMNRLIDIATQCRNEQEEIDNVDTMFCNTLTHEMDTYLKYTSSPRPTKKRLKNSKPYWNQELYDMWIKMSISERVLGKCI